MYYPKAAIAGASILPDHSRAYDIFDRGGHKYRAYRMVFKTMLLGQYYGVTGTNWEGPPILDNPSERRRLGGRTYELFYDGSRLRLISLALGQSRLLDLEHAAVQPGQSADARARPQRGPDPLKGLLLGRPQRGALR